MVVLSDNKQDFYYTRFIQASFNEMKNAHYHPYYELYYLINGKRKFFIDDTIFTLNPGDLIMIPKGSVHRTTYISDKLTERIAMSFSDKLALPIISDIGESSFTHLFSDYLIHIPLGRRDYLEELFAKMDMEHHSLDILSDKMLSTYLEELIIFLLRCKDLSAPISMTHESDDATISAAARYICTHLDENLGLTEVANIFSISPTYFSKKFKNQTGFGFKEYVSLVRSMEAKKLLIETSLSITEIASRCGFESSNYFGDAFKKSLGVSPRDFRKANS